MYGVIAQRPGMAKFIFCMTENKERAASLMNHYISSERRGVIFSTAIIPDDARIGDDFIEAL